MIILSKAIIGATTDALRQMMNKLWIVIFVYGLCLANLEVNAKSGCCSHHGGVRGCNQSTGLNICADGSDSPTCTCDNSNVYNKSSSNNNSQGSSYLSPNSYNHFQSPSDSNNTAGFFYKCVDARGVVHFSDTKPTKDCKIQ